MDIFRKNKKKQQAATAPQQQINSHDAALMMTTSASTSFTDQLDQIAISAAEMENDATFVTDAEAELIAKQKQAKRGNTLSKSGIDALIDSDEEDAEIFNDQEESSDEGKDDSSHLHGTPTSHRSSISSSKIAPTASSPLSSSSKTNSKKLSMVDADVEQSRARLSSFQNEKSKSSNSGEYDAAADTDDNDDDEDDDVDDDDDDGESSPSREGAEGDEEKSNSDSAEDYTDDEDEGEDGYKPGGYHPVKVGEVYNQRYIRPLIWNALELCYCVGLLLTGYVSSFTATLSLKSLVGVTFLQYGW
jgi:hypothetical protein